MSSAAYTMLALGVILGISLLTDRLARRTGLPRITLLVLVGVAFAVFRQLVLGEPDGRPLGALSEPLITLALVMVAFLLGSELTAERLKSTGIPVLTLSLAESLGSALLVGGGLLALGFPPGVALALGAISVATDPAAVMATIEETGDTRFRARVLQGIVALDDALGIILFGLSMTLLGWLTADGGSALGHAGYELAGALALGIAIGLPAALLTGRLSPGQPTRTESIAVILLIAGLASWLEVSTLLTAMVTGCLVVNLSRHHTRSFAEIEGLEWPFLVFFFVLSGASIDLGALGAAVSLLLAYIALRSAGPYLGVRLGLLALGERAAGLPANLGLALTPQAGVAMGMALLAAERLPEQGTVIMTTVVTATIAFESIGPVLVRYTLR